MRSGPSTWAKPAIWLAGRPVLITWRISAGLIRPRLSGSNAGPLPPKRLAAWQAWQYCW